MKIVIADHSGLQRGTDLSAVLAAGGHEVQFVHDGIEALRVARAWPAELVVASVHQPRMDGLALIAALRALGGTGLPAMVLCGPDDDHHARSRARELGVNTYLPLPVQITPLLQVLWRVERAARGPAAAGDPRGAAQGGVAWARSRALEPGRPSALTSGRSPLQSAC
jgi:CheY-like chemotaxis protein